MITQYSQNIYQGVIPIVIPMQNPSAAYVPGDVNDPRNGMTVGAIVGAGSQEKLTAEQDAAYNKSIRGRIPGAVLHHPVAPIGKDLMKEFDSKMLGGNL